MNAAGDWPPKTPTAAPRPRPRSLWPREHGAYVQLLVPAVTSLILTRGALAAAAVALGAGLAFIASEPLRVMLGARGPRMLATAGARARKRLAILAALAATAGGTGLALAPVTAAMWAAVLAPLVAYVIMATRRGTVHSILGESVTAVALSGASAPVAAAGGMLPRPVLMIWLGWSLAFVLTVLAVHHVISRHRKAREQAVDARTILVGGFGIALAGWIALSAGLRFALPLALTAVVVFITTPRATRLRAVGIAFLVSALLSAAWAIAAFLG